MGFRIPSLVDFPKVHQGDLEVVQHALPRHVQTPLTSPLRLWPPLPVHRFPNSPLSTLATRPPAATYRCSVGERGQGPRLCSYHTLQSTTNAHSSDSSSRYPISRPQTPAASLRASSCFCSPFHAGRARSETTPLGAIPSPPPRKDDSFSSLPLLRHPPPHPAPSPGPFARLAPPAAVAHPGVSEQKRSALPNPRPTTAFSPIEG